MHAAGCSPPSSPTNGVVNEYYNGSVGASLTFQCNIGYIPYKQMTSICMMNGTWVPIPQCMLAGMCNIMIMNFSGHNYSYIYNFRLWYSQSYQWSH